jgi:hypothetical protein
VNVKDTVIAELQALEARQHQAQPIPKDASALEVLQMGYRGEVKLTPQQIRCAEATLPHENPRMSAVAVGYLTGDTFAERLERAIQRSDRARMPKLIEARAEPTD